METIEASLSLEHGPQPNLRFPLVKDQSTIGRSAGNDLVLADPEISRRHARLVRQPGYFAIEDMGSTNGTFVNGQRISRLTALQHGDAIDLGDTVRLRYWVEGATGPLAAEPAAGATAPSQPIKPYTEPPAAPVGPVRPAPPAAQQRPPTVESHRPPEPAAPIPAQPQAPPRPVAAASPAPVQPIPQYAYEEGGGGRRALLLGCGVIVAALLVCAGTFLLLDSYRQGQLLYCGSLRPVFELLLGPFGFAPLCG